MALHELNTEIGKIKQDFLLFKKEILIQMTNLEEKFNLKLDGYNAKFSKQNDLYEKKFDKLITQITHVNSMIINNVGINLFSSPLGRGPPKLRFHILVKGLLLKASSTG